jgi:hypothetical protein
MAMLIDHGCLGTSATQRRPRRKNQLQIIIRLFVSFYPFSDLKQMTQLNERRNTVTYG